MNNPYQTYLPYGTEDSKKVINYCKDTKSVVLTETFEKNILHGKKNYYEKNKEKNKIVKTELYDKGELVCVVNYDDNNKIVSIVFDKNANVQNVQIETKNIISNF